MAAYADAVSLALYLQRDLTDGEEEAAAAACAAASDYIDRYVGRSWQGTAITGELQTILGPIVALDHRPVASVASVTARSLLVGETPRVLVAGTDYELIDALNGLLLVNAPYDVITTPTSPRGTVLTISYVVDATPPVGIKQAANIIAAQYLTSAVAYFQQARGIQKLKAGSAEITYDPIESAGAMPPAAKTLLDVYRPVATFA